MGVRVSVFNCYFHFNKLFPEAGPLNKMLVWFNGVPYGAPKGMVCKLPTFSYERNEQPYIVMACVAANVWFTDEGVLVVE
jgi:hypothetical protein